MYKIQMLNAISPVGLKLLPSDLYDVSAEMKNPDAIWVRSQDMHTMSFPPSVKMVGRAGAGVNNIPIDKLTQLGIPILNTPGANANAVKELVLAGMFLASRHLFQAMDYVRQLSCQDDDVMNEQVEKQKKQFSGFELLGKTLGVIGLGSIGVKVANAAQNLGMRVIGYDPTITVNRAWELSSDIIQATNFEHVLRESDFISLHIPLNDQTKHMLSHDQFGLMKKGLVLLNFSRDGIVDNNALLDAINENKVFAYICDFPSVALKASPRVITFPHLGASTQQAEENCAMMLANQTRQFLETGSIINSVNFPSIEMPQNHSPVRLVIVNENIPNMVAQISAKLADRKINIISLLNKSQNEIACTLADVNADLDDGLLDEVRKIKGVVGVRKIVF
jgi:D-3-phosphoglycerate dehydrogenase